MDEVFKTVLAVVDYLQDQGWRIAKSAAYDHHKQGKLRAEPDGTFTPAAVEEYARRWLRKAAGNPLDKGGSLQRLKLEAETKRLEAQAAMAEHKVKILSGSWITIQEHERELTARAQLFRTDLRNFARSSVGEIIATVDGNPDRAPELMEYMLDHVDEFLDRYARETEFEVKADAGE